MGICFLLVFIFVVTPLHAATTVTWTDHATDEAYYVIERRTLTGTFGDRSYDFVGPNTEVYIDPRPDPKQPCYAVTAVSHQGVRSVRVETCTGGTP